MLRDILNICIAYCHGMYEYDINNPITIKNQWTAFQDEMTEFVDECRACNVKECWSEGWDCLHSFLRLLIVFIFHIPICGKWFHKYMIWIPLFGWKTAKKHAIRWKQKRCIRSDNHCNKKPCAHTCVTPGARNNSLDNEIRVFPVHICIGTVDIYVSSSTKDR